MHFINTKANAQCAPIETMCSSSASLGGVRNAATSDSPFITSALIAPTCILTLLLIAGFPLIALARKAQEQDRETCRRSSSRRENPCTAVCLAGPRPCAGQCSRRSRTGFFPGHAGADFRLTFAVGCPMRSIPGPLEPRSPLLGPLTPDYGLVPCSIADV